MPPNSDESNERLLEEDATDEIIEIRKAPSYLTQTKTLWALVGLLIASNLLWGLALFAISLDSRGNGLNYHLRKLSASSPLFDKINLRLHSQKLDGGFELNSSIFRQPPSDLVDKAWKDLSFEDFQFVNVTAQDIKASGKDPANRVRWEESVDAYPAQIEFAHKIHCLNQIRKEIWGEHYFGVVSIDSADKDHENGKNQAVEDEEENVQITNKPTQTSLKGARQMHREHAMHCLHMVLQDLMCNVDVGIITHEWLKDPAKPANPAFPMADFSTTKQCRDFDAAAAWIHSNAMPDGDKKFSALARP